MALELFLGSLVVLTLVAAVIVIMTSASRVDFSDDERRAKSRKTTGKLATPSRKS